MSHYTNFLFILLSWFYCFLDRGRNLFTKQSSHRRCSVKEDILKSFANLTAKQLCWSLFLTMFQAWRRATLLKRFQYRYFPVKFAKFLKNIYFKERLEMTASDQYQKSLLESLLFFVICNEKLDYNRKSAFHY